MRPSFVPKPIYIFICLASSIIPRHCLKIHISIDHAPGMVLRPRFSLHHRIHLLPQLLLLQTVLLGTVFVERGHAAPIRVPDLGQCELASASSVTGPPLTLQFNCCLPVPSHKAVDFSFDAYPPVRKHVRRPAHRASQEYIAKYNKAYELMRALPADDPRSFAVQANIHCAFCNGAYMQGGAAGDVPLQVHFSWLFLAWHRWYLYFHERILGSLVNDPGFSLVFWNWDDQRDGGNVIPAMFARNATALYDANRNQHNLPPTLVRLSPLDNSTNNSVVINQNLNSMYQALVTASTAELFMGGAYRLGTNLTNSTVLNAPLGGSIETSVHNGIHFWTGDPVQPLSEDMATFSTAARDPIFYAHHSNVDRLWDVWRFNIPGGQRKDHSDPDFLDAEFLFYDENANLVKVKVRDALDNQKLGVSYKKVRADDLWLNYSPLPVSNGSAAAAAAANGVPKIGASPQNGTVDLGDKLTALVSRPSGNKPPDTEEVLVIQGVDVTRDSFVQLVVFVNLPDAGTNTETSSAEYVGTFNIIASTSKHNHLLANVKFEIGDNLKRIGIQNEDMIVITILVKGQEKVTIKGLQIKYE